MTVKKLTLPKHYLKDGKKGGGIREIVNLADNLEKQGKEIFHLEIGRPDFNSPRVAIDGAIAALNKGLVHYPDMLGVEELRVALSQKLKAENHLNVASENILVTVGAASALSASIFTLFNEGDEVLVPVPCFVTYRQNCELIGAKMIPVRCKFENGFKVEPADLAAAITDRTRGIILNTPNNPSGASYDPDRLKAIAKIAVDNDLVVLSDECYERFLYEGEFISMASLPGMEERTITIGAASKTYSMTGWRMGYAAMPSWMTPHILRTHLAMNTSPASFCQYGYAEALKSAEPSVKIMIGEYKNRRDLMVERLRAMPKLKLVAPEGAFYVFPSIEGTGMSDVAFCHYMLNEAGVAMVPGEAFEMAGFVRLAYCREYEYLERALDRVEAALLKI